MLTVDTLRVGQHCIVFRATDAGGSIAFAFIDITIVPATGGRVVGSVTVDGAPYYGARIDLSSTPARNMLTNAQGAYAFEDVSAGAYSVSVASINCVSFPTPSQSVAVAVGVRTTVNFAGVRSSGCGDGSGTTPGYRPSRNRSP